MELCIRVPAGEAGRLLVGITQDGIAFGLGAGRKVSFQGASGDITVKLLAGAEDPLSAPVPAPEAAGADAEEVPRSMEGAPGEEPGLPGLLFAKLAGLRKQIAAEEGHPPFLIFHDSTLSQMCRVLPRDLQELKAIPGIGEAKLTKYGQRFLDAINN